MAYHSSFNEEKDLKLLCNMALLPLKTKYKGPALPAPAGKKKRKKKILIQVRN